MFNEKVVFNVIILCVKGYHRIVRYVVKNMEEGKIASPVARGGLIKMWGL